MSPEDGGHLSAIECDRSNAARSGAAARRGYEGPESQRRSGKSEACAQVGTDGGV